MKAVLGVLALAATSQAANVLSYTSTDCSGTATTLPLTHEGLVGGSNPEAQCITVTADSRKETTVCTNDNLVLTATRHTGTVTCNNANPTATVYTLDATCRTLGTGSYRSEYAIKCTTSRFYKYVDNTCVGVVSSSGFAPLGLSDGPCNDRATTSSNRVVTTCTGTHLTSTIRTWNANSCPANAAGTDSATVIHNNVCALGYRSSSQVRCDNQNVAVEFFSSNDCSTAVIADTTALRTGTKSDVQTDLCERRTVSSSRRITWSCPAYTAGLAAVMPGTVTVNDFATPTCDGTATTSAFVGDGTCRTTTYNGHAAYRLRSVDCNNILSTWFTTPDCTLRPVTSNYVTSLSTVGCTASGVNSLYTEQVCSGTTGNTIERVTTYYGSTICRTVTGQTTPTVVDRIYSGECVRVSAVQSYKFTKIPCKTNTRAVSIFATADCSGTAGSSETAYTYSDPSSNCKIDNSLTAGSFKESSSCSSSGFKMTVVSRWNSKDDCGTPTTTGGANVTHDVRRFYVVDGLCHSLVGHPTGGSYRVNGTAVRCRGTQISSYLDNQCRIPYEHRFSQEDVNQGSCMTTPEGGFNRQDVSCASTGGFLQGSLNWYTSNLCTTTVTNNVALTSRFDGECYRATLADGTKITQRAAEVACSVPATAPVPVVDSDDDKSGIIAGAVIGGLCFIIIIIFIIHKCCCSGGEENTPDAPDEA